MEILLIQFKEKTKILTVFDDMIADMFSKKTFNIHQIIY